jgi:hypothetical protein
VINQRSEFRELFVQLRVLCDAALLFTVGRHECHAAVVIHMNELVQERGRRPMA